MPRLSIIIPVLGSAPRLESTLVSVLENRPTDCEIIVVLNAPYDDPYDLKDEVRYLHVGESAGIVESLNTGIQASRAAIVHLLASGFEVTEGWTDSVWSHFRDPHVAGVGPLVVDVLDSRKVLAAGLESAAASRIVRSFGGTDDVAGAQQILGPLVQAAFFRRSALELVGGLPQAVGDSLADVDLALTLKYAGYHCMLEPASRVEAVPGDIALDTAAGFRNGLAAERLFWRNAPVLGWKKSLAMHPLAVLGEFVAGLPHWGTMTRLCGRLLGCCQFGNYRAHHEWLDDVRRAAAALFRAGRPTFMRVDAAHPVERGGERGVRVEGRTVFPSQLSESKILQARSAGE